MEFDHAPFLVGQIVLGSQRFATMLLADRCSSRLRSKIALGRALRNVVARPAVERILAKAEIKLF
jgi:hypothetical protein